VAIELFAYGARDENGGVWTREVEAGGVATTEDCTEGGVAVALEVAGGGYCGGGGGLNGLGLSQSKPM
jgi:hypothetical protein